jgi:hypothetical protein
MGGLTSRCALDLWHTRQQVAALQTNNVSTQHIRALLGSSFPSQWYALVICTCLGNNISTRTSAGMCLHVACEASRCASHPHIAAIDADAANVDKRAFVAFTLRELSIGHCLGNSALFQGGVVFSCARVWVLPQPGFCSLPQTLSEPVAYDSM